MFEKPKKETWIRLITMLLVAAIALLTLNVLTGSTDRRRQIADTDGGTEERLCTVLSSIQGAGDVDVMVEYGNDAQVKGVIVLAQGASDPVVENDLTRGVATLYGIPVSSVAVFEMKE